MKLTIGLLYFLQALTGVQGSYPHTYIGCFVFGHSLHVTETVHYNYYNNDVELCVTQCGQEGDRYAGLMGHLCLCGNSGYDTVRVDDNCTMPCVGNSNQTCGGDYSMSTYEIGGYAHTYIGCFGNREPWTLIESIHYNYHNTVELCVAKCGLGGYIYAGLAGRVCLCGNAGYDTQGRKDDCIYTCFGNTSQICGALESISVYEVVLGITTTATGTSATSAIYTTTVAPTTTAAFTTTTQTTAMPTTAMSTAARPTTAMPRTAMSTTAMPTTVMPATAMSTVAMPTTTTTADGSGVSESRDGSDHRLCISYGVGAVVVCAIIVLVIVIAVVLAVVLSRRQKFCVSNRESSAAAFNEDTDELLEIM